MMFTTLPVFNVCWLQMTFDLHKKTKGISFSPMAIYEICLNSNQLSLLEILCSHGFRHWTLWTSNDLWPPWKREHLLINATDIPSLRFKQTLLLEISCLQAKMSHTYAPIFFLNLIGRGIWPLKSHVNVNSRLRCRHIFQQLIASR